MVTKETRDAVQQFLQAEYPGKQLIFINGTDDASTAQWLKTIQKTNEQSHLSSLNIDYDIYGAGEAMLAWLDDEFELYSDKGNAVEDAVLLANNIFQQLKNNKLPIGHLKLLINQQLKISYTEIQTPDIPATIPPAAKAEVILNARVQTDPETLRKIISDAMNHLQEEKKCIIKITNSAAFVPGYPRPTYRIINTISA